MVRNQMRCWHIIMAGASLVAMLSVMAWLVDGTAKSGLLFIQFSAVAIVLINAVQSFWLSRACRDAMEVQDALIEMLPVMNDDAALEAALGSKTDSE